MKEQLKEQKLLLLSITFLILFNFPIISIFNVETTINGIPTLYFYVFTLWIMMITLIFIIVNKDLNDTKHKEIHE